MEPKRQNIEQFFLDVLLKIIIAGLVLIILANIIFFPEDSLSIIISASILIASIISFTIKSKHPSASVLIVTSIALIGMCYQRITLPATSTTLSVVLIIGFIYSIMLKGRLMLIMHSITFIILNTIFVIHVKDYITAAITYSIMYFVLCYASGILKYNYDRINKSLKSKNEELADKAEKIKAQNEELLQIQDSMNTLNQELENLIQVRTAKIQVQNEALIKYSFSNAHHLRGPVARMLGLANLYELDKKSEPEIILKMVEQAKEIDIVIKQINSELEAANIDLSVK